MKQRNNTLTLTAMAAITAVGSLLAGCGSDGSTMTKAQEDAIRHPTAAADHKGPTAQDRQKMQTSIEAYRQKHANDKVEFK